MTMRSMWIVCSLLLAASASAHHGWSGNSSEPFELTGIIETPLRLAGAHATMQIRVANQLWDITLAPPARTERAGLKADTIPVGATVTISGHRHADPKRFEVKTERVTHAGKLYNVYPDRN